MRRYPSRRDRRAQAKANKEPFVPLQQKPSYAGVPALMKQGGFPIQTNANLDASQSQIARCREEGFAFSGLRVRMDPPVIITPSASDNHPRR